MIKYYLKYENPLMLPLKIIHKEYIKRKGIYWDYLACEKDAQKASDIIYEELCKDKPSMIARFGSVELNFTVNHIGVVGKHNIIDYIKGITPQFWYNKLGISQLKTNAGFFPLTREYLKQYAELVISDSNYIDILGSWRLEERFLVDETKINAIHLPLLEPFHCTDPWTKYLKGKRVLVVHPFAETIKSQYKKRKVLFNNPHILPDFELQVIKSVQSIGGNSDYQTWFDALEWMKNLIDKQDYDVCLIGCGAYGLHLAAHVKRNGKKAIHLGGALQLLFGIKGNRWENPQYGVARWGIEEGFYKNLLNNASWVRPSNEETPTNSKSVEHSCYW